MDYTKELKAEIDRLNAMRESELQRINTKYDSWIKTVIRDSNEKT